VVPGLSNNLGSMAGEPAAPPFPSQRDGAHRGAHKGAHRYATSFMLARGPAAPTTLSQLTH
jgi:hypothetical protein